MGYKDREVQLEAQRKHYKDNKEDYRNRSRSRRKERKEWFRKLMVDKFCIKCGESDIACLDFHHIDPKTKDDTVSRLLAYLRSKERILKEIEKCEVLCANCHRKFHRYSEIKSVVGSRLALEARA